MTEKITERVTHGQNYTLSLPFVAQADEGTKRFAEYYDRMRERAASFAEEDTLRIRSYKSYFKVTEDGELVRLEVTLTARLKERGKCAEKRTKVICDVWSRGNIVSHSVTES